MLITLSYRIPEHRIDDVLGTLTAYSLTGDFLAAWDRLPTGWEGNDRRRPPYAALATTLCATTGQYVRLFADYDIPRTERAAAAARDMMRQAPGQLAAETRALLLASAPLDYRFRTAVRVWERLVHRGEDVNSLAPLIGEPQPQRPFSRYLTLRPGHVPLCPNWVYRTAAWRVAERLATRPLHVDGYRRPVPLRVDTNGDVLAWDDIVPNADDNAHAMVRIGIRLVTHPGVTEPVLCFDAHVTRIGNRWAGVKNARIDRGLPDTPILHLPVRGRPNGDGTWHNFVASHVPEILEACDLTAISLPAEFNGRPGAVRPIQATNRRHPIGHGPGARFMLRLHEHITTCLPELLPLTYIRDRRLSLPPRIEQYGDGLPAGAVAASGFTTVRIVGLYATLDARTRMLTELENLTARPLQTLADGVERPLGNGLQLITDRAPDLLAHGADLDRGALLDAMPVLDAGEATLVVGWLETEWHPSMNIPAHLDAKHDLHRRLAARGIPTQFLATDPLILPPGARPRTPAARKHSAHGALRDLLRSAGVLDHRIAAATTATRLGHRLSQPALLVGIHARRQNTETHNGRKIPARLVLTAAALHATPDPTACWPLSRYSSSRNTWLPAGPGLADFHAGPIGDAEHGRTDEKAARSRSHVEAMLARLVYGTPADLPVVIFVDARATRSLWPGLADPGFGTGELPGDTLVARGRDVAVVRCNDTEKVGRPVTRHGEGAQPRDPMQPAAPGRRVYQLADTTEPVWFFPGVSRTYDSKGGNLGARYTRWTLPPHLAHLIREPWHSYTGVEIAIARAGSFEPVTLTALTARLMEQPISWDGRTRFPTPLHLAVTADLDHPDHPSTDAAAMSDSSSDGEAN